jgi:hypothetical protein
VLSAGIVVMMVAACVAFVVVRRRAAHACLHGWVCICVGAAKLSGIQSGHSVWHASPN